MPLPKCDRCDGCHTSAECPHFRWPRADHPDACPLCLEDRPSVAPDSAPIEAAGVVEKQPGDGSCLYHSLDFGVKALGLRSSGSFNLRQFLAAWVKRNGGVVFNGQSIQTWLQAELGSSMTVAQYAQRQSRVGWGGSLEILSFVLSKNMNVWIWVPIGRGRFRRTTCFQVQDRASVGRIDLCLTNAVHYDYVQLNKTEIVSQMQVKLKLKTKVSELVCACLCRRHDAKQ